MRAPTLRATLAVLTIVLPAAGGALVACSGSSGGSGSGGGAPDASEAAASEGGARDSSVPHDGASIADTGTTPGNDAGDSGGGGVGDASDAAPGFAEGGGFAGDCGVGQVGEPTELRCTGLYSDWSQKAVAASAQPYEPGVHLWSDGADKSRWIYLPPGQKIDTSNMDEWTFPVGTKIWKEFRLTLGDASAETRIETRLLWKAAAGQWYRTTYVWSPDGTSSTNEVTYGVLDAGGTGYEIPSQGECDQCHNGRLDGVLGFEAIALSMTGATGLDMQQLTAQDLLTAAPTAPLVIPGNATEQPAIAWLHMNCGTSCHNGGNGQAEPTGFFMRLDVDTLSTVKTTDVYTYGWNKTTQNFEIPDAATTYRLHACDTASSAVIYRAGHRSGVDGTPLGVQMPPIVSHQVDGPDLAAIAAWIDEGCDGGL